MSTASAVVPVGYKLTEIGVIPEDWNISKLGNIISYTKGFAFRSNDYRKYGTRIIQVSDTDANGIHDNNAVYIDANNSHVYSKWRLQYGDIIVSTVGSKPPMYDSLVAKSTFIPKKYEGSLLNQNAVILRAKSGMLDQQIILHSIFQSKRYLTHIEKIYRGNANQASITLTELFDFLIIMPTDNLEIESVSKALVEFDSNVQAFEDLIAKKKDIKQGAMQELLTGKTRLPGFIGEWELKSIGEIAQVIGGGTPSTQISQYWGGNINWFTPTEVGSTKYVFDSERKLTDSGLQNSSASLLPIGAILLTSRAGVGDLAILSISACTNQGFQSMVCNEKANNEFLYYVLLTKRAELKRRSSGSTFLEISPRELKSLLISLPQFNEQEAIAEVLSDMDAEIAALEERLEKAKAIKQGMMQQLLTGKIRLVEPQTSQEVSA